MLLRRISTATAVAAFAAAFLPGAQPVLAQDPVLPGQADSTLVDGVAAVVGDSAITMSEVTEGLFIARNQGQQDITPDEVLETLVNTQLILQAAARDTTIQVTDEEIDQRVEQAVAQVRERFETEQEFQTALQGMGMTRQTYRDQLRRQIRTEQIRRMFLQRRAQSMRASPVTEAEMRAFYEEQRSNLQARPELLTVEQVLVGITASDEAWEEARREADSLRSAVVEGGANFAEVAREHSDDPGSAAEGGDLGWFRQNSGFVREFVQEAFRLPDDSVSQPVRTRFGWHLIKVERRRPGERKARHMLIRPELVDADETRARETAEDVARRVREGEPIAELKELHGDSDQPLDFTVSRDQLAELPLEGYTSSLSGATEGEVIGPFRTELGPDPYFAVLRVEEIREAGEFTFDDLRDQIRQTLTQQRTIERIYEELRDQFYVDIRM